MAHRRRRRPFHVPPNFLQAATIRKGKESNDPFAEKDDGDGKLPVQLGITDLLKQSGVSFPEGASATYTPSNNTLIVRNTPGNIDLVDQLVSLVTSKEPAMVIIRSTIIRVSEENLKELGFDWAITPLGLGGGLHLGGGSTGNGTPLGAAFGSFHNSRPVTSGNRSGNSALPGSAIQSFLNANQTGTAADSSLRAPGILKLTAITNGMAIEMLMRGLNQNTGADVMVKPSTISRSGERSKIEVIREFIYPTEYEPPELPNRIESGRFFDSTTGERISTTPSTPATPAHPTAFETRNVGITLAAASGPTWTTSAPAVPTSTDPEPSDASQITTS